MYKYLVNSLQFNHREKKKKEVIPKKSGLSQQQADKQI